MLLRRGFRNRGVKCIEGVDALRRRVPGHVREMLLEEGEDLGPPHVVLAYVDRARTPADPAVPQV